MAIISSVIPIESAWVGLFPTSSSGALTLGKSWKSRRENMIHSNWVRPDAVHPKDKILLGFNSKKGWPTSTFYFFSLAGESGVSQNALQEAARNQDLPRFLASTL